MGEFEGQRTGQFPSEAGALPPDHAPAEWTEAPVFEPASAGTLQPPTAPVRTTSRPPRLRLLTAIVATIAVLVTAIGVLAFTASSSGASPTLAYTPATSAAYVEFRLDLPGDQRDQLARFLAHFPGFADTTILERKLSDAFDRVTADATKARYSYSGDFAPWATGPVAFAVITMPGPSTASTPSEVLASEHVAVLVGVKDAAKAQTELGKLKDDAVAAGLTASSTDVQGTTVWTLGDGTSDMRFSYALAADMLMVTLRPDDIGALLDVKAGRAAGLGSSSAYRNASAGAPADRLASLYVNTRAALGAADASGPLASLLPSGTLENLPDAVFGTFRAESDRLILDVRYTGGAAAAKVRPSAIADHVPGTAIAYVEAHDVGQGIATLVTQLKALPQVQDQLGSLSQVEGLLGGNLESFVSWIGDVGVVVEAPRGVGQVPVVGIVATVADESVAKAKLAQLRNLIALGGATGGLTVTDADHNGVTITTIGSMAGSSTVGPGMSLGLIGSVSYAVADGRFILGVGPDFVPEVLDLQVSDSLARAGGFSDALQAAGGPESAGLMYLDVRSIRDAAEATIPAAQRDAYDANTRPYLAPFDKVIALIGASGSTPFARMVVTVSTP